MTEKILFRASSFANLLVENRDTKITPVQIDRIDELNYEMEFGLNKNGNKVKWTDTKASELQTLIKKRDAKPELSLTAKKEVEKIWRFNEKGFLKNLENRYVMKGLFSEEDGIDLLCDVEGQFYLKNDERITIGNISGECDIVHIEEGKKIIKDIKCNFDAETFMNADFSTLYEIQGRVYMYLYDADEFHLHYCLVDCPPHIYESEVWKLRNRYGITDPDTPEAKPIFDQLRRNLIYSDNPNYTKEERVKTYKIKRDRDFEQKILDVIPMALEYYSTLTLNKV